MFEEAEERAAILKGFIDTVAISERLESLSLPAIVVQ